MSQEQFKSDLPQDPGIDPQKSLSDFSAGMSNLPGSFLPEEKIQSHAARYLSAFSADNTNIKEAERIIKDITGLLSENGIYVFLNETLDLIIRNSHYGPQIEPLRLLELIKQCAENDSVENSLNIILKRLPSEPMNKIAGMLNYIASSSGSASSEIFNKYLPAMIENEADFSFTDLYNFSNLSYCAGAETARFCEVLLTRFAGKDNSHWSLVEGIVFLQQASEKVSRWTVADCLNFYCDLSDHAATGRYKNPTVSLWSCAERAWNTWGDKYNKQVSEQVTDLLANMQDKVNPELINELLEALTINGEQAGKIACNLTHISQAGDPDLLLSCVRRVKRMVSMIGTDYLPDLTRYYASTELSGKAAIAESTLAQFVKLFGVSRIEKNINFFAEAFSRFDESDLYDLKRELRAIETYSLDMLLSDYPISLSALNYLLLGVHKGGQEIFNEWPIPESEVFRRWEKYAQFSRPPVIVADLSDNFEIPYRPEGFNFKIRVGEELDTKFISGRDRIYTELNPEMKLFILKKIADTLEISARISLRSPPAEIIPLLVEASRRNDLKLFDLCLRMSLGLLPQATSVRLAEMNNKFLSGAEHADRVYDYLESLRLLIDDRLPVTFEQQGMERFYIDRIKQIACLHQINAELKKFEKLDPTEMLDIMFVTAKNITDAFYDQMAETCILEKSSDDLQNPIFQPIRLVSMKLHKIVGCWYVLKKDILGQPSMILAGGGPQGSLTKAVDADLFIYKCLNVFRDIARKNNLSGGLYQAVGPATDKDPWTDLGRVAQHPDIKKALVRRNAAIIELSDNEHINFPTDYFKGTRESPVWIGPIKRVVKL